MVTFKVEPDGNEFHAWSPELPGCHTHGRTISEALENLKDAAYLYLQTLMEESFEKYSVHNFQQNEATGTY